MGKLTTSLGELAANLRSDPSLQGKRDINVAREKLALHQGSFGKPGDDCAVIPDQDGFLLFAIEGFINQFVEQDPWFAGWCGVMVNLSDVMAMGGRPLAVTDAIWAAEPSKADVILEGMRTAAETYDIPIVGGHTNFRSEQSQLAVSILGRAKHLITSFDAKPGDLLVAAIDHRGEYRAPFNNWQAALSAPKDQLRANMEILPGLAEEGLCKAGKDISQGGIVGTVLMLAECSNVAITIDLNKVGTPIGVDLERWLISFPSFGFLLAVDRQNVDAVHRHFERHGIWTGTIGTINEGSLVSLKHGDECEVIWDHARSTYLGLKKESILHA